MIFQSNFKNYVEFRIQSLGRQETYWFWTSLCKVWLITFEKIRPTLRWIDDTTSIMWHMTQFCTNHLNVTAVPCLVEGGIPWSSRNTFWEIHATEEWLHDFPTSRSILQTWERKDCNELYFWFGRYSIKGNIFFKKTTPITIVAVQAVVPFSHLLLLCPVWVWSVMIWEGPQIGKVASLYN